MEMGRLRWLCLLCLILLVQACGRLSDTPPQSVVERGLAMKMAQTQQMLITHLAPRVPQLPNVKLRQVEVTLREAQGDHTFHVQGTYQAVIQLASREKQESGPFDLYIAKETTEDTVSWFLLSDTAPDGSAELQKELLVTNPA